MSTVETRESIFINSGWGECHDDVVAKVSMDWSRNNPSGDLKERTELYLTNRLERKVVELGDEHFTIDANPNMAGTNYQVKIALPSHRDPRMKKMGTKAK